MVNRSVLPAEDGTINRGCWRACIYMSDLLWSNLNFLRTSTVVNDVSYKISPVSQQFYCSVTEKVLYLCSHLGRDRTWEQNPLWLHYRREAVTCSRTWKIQRGAFRCWHRKVLENDTGMHVTTCCISSSQKRRLSLDVPVKLISKSSCLFLFYRFPRQQRVETFLIRKPILISFALSRPYLHQNPPLWHLPRNLNGSEYRSFSTVGICTSR